MSTADVPVTVVTPFHNTAEYLGECIESVLAQTHRRFEYVLVDNQSDDGSTAIAQRYAERDSRVRVIRNPELLGQVANYNRALRAMAPSSRYLKVVQADDTIFPRCLEEMVALAEANPRVAIVSSYRLHGDVVEPGPPGRQEVMPGRAACRLMLIDGIFLFGSPTTLLFRADIVRARDPFWREGRLNEDTEAAFEILRDHDFGFVHQILSFSRLDPRSVMGQVADLGPHRLGQLIIYRMFGREVLSDEEYRRYAVGHEARYRRFLFEAWLDGRGPEFWAFHRKWLATIDETLSPVAIARSGAWVLLDRGAPPALLDALGRGKRWMRSVVARARSGS